MIERNIRKLWAAADYLFHLHLSWFVLNIALHLQTAPRQLLKHYCCSAPGRLLWLLVAWWVEVWCMALSLCGTSPAPLNTRAQSSRWEPAWCRESQRYWLNLIFMCKQKNRWPHCQTSFTSTGSRNGTQGRQRSVWVFFPPVFFCPARLTYIKTALAFEIHWEHRINNSSWTRRERDESVLGRCICKIQCALNPITHTTHSCVSDAHVLITHWSWGKKTITEC